MIEISLNGKWTCQYPDGRKLSVVVPGCFDGYIAQKDIGGIVTYERDFTIAYQRDKRYFIHFGAVSYYCDIYVNGLLAGSHEGMWDPFMIDITDRARDGDNTIRIDVIKPGYYENDRYPVRQVLSGFIPDVLHTFGGLWGDVKLLAGSDFTPESHYANGTSKGDFKVAITLQAFCDNKEILIETKITDPNNVEVWNGKQTLDPVAGDNELFITGSVAYPMLWSVHTPNLYKYQCMIKTGDNEVVLTGTLGFRTISSEGTKILLNDESLYFRGILHWGLYDKEVTPTPCRDKIKKEMNDILAYGFNAIKHCLYIPSDDALDEADKAGILLWVELPLWVPEKADELPDRIRREYPRLIKKLIGHPSVIIISCGCELNNVIDAPMLEEMYTLVRSETNTLICDNSGSGECYGGISESFSDFFSYHFYSDIHNLENLMETFTPTWRNTKPWLCGEYCDNDALRDVRELRKRYGVEKLDWESHDPAINPQITLGKEIYMPFFDEHVAGNDMLENFPRLQELSKAHSLAHRKATLEMTRAFPEICGYNVTALRDVPMCPTGMFNDFGEANYDVGQFRESNDDVVLVPAWDLTKIYLAGGDRIMNRERYNFSGGSDYSLHILLSNYSRYDITGVNVKWQLCDGKAAVLSGNLSGDDVKQSAVKEICYLRFCLPTVDAPETYVLRVVAEYNGGVVKNEWPVFVYPALTGINHRIGLYDPVGVFTRADKLYDLTELYDGVQVDPNLPAVLTSRLSPEIKHYAENGGLVFLVQRGKGPIPTVAVPFWREGLVCRDFTSFWNELPIKHWADDLRFFSLSTDTAFDIDSLSTLGPVHPMVRRYDCRKWLASDYMCEISMGKGRLVATTLRLEGGMGKQPMFLENNYLGRWIIEQSLKLVCTN